MTADPHVVRIRTLCVPGGPLAPKAPTTTVRNPAWFRVGPSGRPEPRAVRAQLHEQLLEKEWGEWTPAQDNRRPRAVVLAGPPGAGKSTITRQVLGERHDYLETDADSFKSHLLNQARQDGSLEEWIKPPEVRDLEAEGERFAPLEFSALVHEESSLLVEELRTRAIQAGRDLIIDTVLGGDDPATTRELGARLERAGYDVRVIDVEVPYEVSRARIESRWSEGRAEFFAGRDDLGGRWVPSEFARSVYFTDEGVSKPERNAELLANECTAVSRFERWRTTQAAEDAAIATGQRATPVLEVNRARPAPAARLVDGPVAVGADGARAARLAASRPPRTQGQER